MAAILILLLAILLFAGYALRNAHHEIRQLRLHIQAADRQADTLLNERNKWRSGYEQLQQHLHDRDTGYDTIQQFVYMNKDLSALWEEVANKLVSDGYSSPAAHLCVFVERLAKEYKRGEKP